MTEQRIDKKLLVRNAGYSLAGQTVPLLLAVAFIPRVIHGLGTERFGLLSIAWVILSYFNLFDLGITKAVTRLVAKAIGQSRAQEIPALVWTATGAQVVLGVLGMSVLWLITPFLAVKLLKISPALQPEAIRTFHILALAIPVVLVYGSFQGLLEASLRFDLVGATKMLYGSASSVIPFVGVVLGKGLPEIVGYMLLFRVFMLIAIMIICGRIFPALFNGFRFYAGVVPEMASYGMWITSTNAISIVLDRLDHVLIGAFLSMSDVAYYAVPQNMLSRLWIFPYSVASVLFPTFSVLEENISRVKAAYLKSVVGIGFIALPLSCGAVLFSPELLSIWLGRGIGEKSAFVATVLAAGGVIAILAPIPMTAIQSLNRPDLITKVLCVQLAVYPAALWFGAHVAKLNGVAVVLAIRAIFQTQAFLWLAKRLIKLDRAEEIHLRKALFWLFGAMVVSFASAEFLAPMSKGIILAVETFLSGYFLSREGVFKVIRDILNAGKK